MTDPAEIEAIKRLKYKYLRCLDTKAWDELAECFSEDATCAYDAGVHTFQGRDEIMRFLEGALGRASMLTMHHVHHPEIEMTSEDAANGRWYLEDCVIDTQNNTTLRGTAFYRDEYVKIGGDWKIKFTGYERVFEETQDRRETPSLKITRSMFPLA